MKTFETYSRDLELLRAIWWAYFFMALADKESALYITHRTRQDWYPRARVIVHAEERK